MNVGTRQLASAASMIRCPSTCWSSISIHRNSRLKSRVTQNAVAKTRPPIAAVELRDVGIAHRNSSIAVVSEIIDTTNCCLFEKNSHMISCLVSVAACVRVQDSSIFAPLPDLHRRHGTSVQSSRQASSVQSSRQASKRTLDYIDLAADGRFALAIRCHVTGTRVIS